MVCLDSDVIIDFLRRDKITIAKLFELKKSSEKIATTTITAFELFKGLPHLSEQSRYDAAEIFLDNVKIFKFTTNSARKAAQIFNDLRSRGESIELTDIMIAAICIENQESLLTKNTQHFSRIKELTLVSY